MTQNSIMSDVETGNRFSGRREEAREFLRTLDMPYVYILRRPDKRVFYVGKGKNFRALEHVAETRHEAKYASNPHKINVINKILSAQGEIVYEIDSIHKSDEAAFEREAFLICSFGRLHEGGPLTNLAPGGGSSAGPAPLSKERHQKSLGGIPDNDPEKAILNEYLLSIGSPKSICIKVLGRTTKPTPTKPYAKKKVGQSARQAYALVASAAANGIELVPNCIIPRQFEYRGVIGFIENGVSCDMDTSGMADVLKNEIPLREAYRLNQDQLQIVIDYVGRVKLEDMGVL